MKQKLNNILVVFDVSGFNPLSLEMLIDLAEGSQSGVRAIYIEDENLFNAVALPFSREVSLLTAGIRSIQSLQLKNSLRTDAENTKKQIERIALSRRINVDFQSTRGHKIQVIRNRSEDVNMVLIPAIYSTATGKSQHQIKQLVALIYNPASPLSQKSLNIALTQADKCHTSLFIMLEQFETEQAHLDVDVIFSLVNINSADAVLSELNKYKFGLIVLTEECMILHDEKLLEKMIATVESDILILREDET